MCCGTVVYPIGLDGGRHVFCYCRISCRFRRWEGAGDLRVWSKGLVCQTGRTSAYRIGLEGLVGSC